MNINLESYKIFYSVAKNQNITKAAHELLISQPGVSKSIQNLERQLGTTLFIRSKRGVSLTEEGKILYEEIKDAFDLVEHAEQRLLEVLNLEAGTLRIGISNTLTQKYLLPYLESFHKQYPNIKLTIYTGTTNILIQKARNNVIDFIILNLPYPVPNDFNKESLMEVHDIFIANNIFSDLKNKIINIEDLNQYPLVLLAKGSNTRTFLDDFTMKHNILLKADMEFTSNILVTEFSKIGFGIGYTTKEFIKDELQNGKLFEVKTSPAIPKREIGLIYVKNKVFSKISKKFIEQLKK